MTRVILCPPELTSALRAGRVALGVERLVLAIHDVSFPSTADEDIGRGSPYGKGARHLTALARELGFDGLQFGPQGDTSATNPSPYDGALFSKSPLSLALATLAEQPEWAPLADGLLAPLVEERPAGPPNRAQYGYAWHAAQATVTALHERFLEARAAGGGAAQTLGARFARFREANQAALGPDAIFAALAARHGTDDWRRWPMDAASPDRELLCAPPSLRAAAQARAAALASEPGGPAERHLFAQFALDEQHRALRAALAPSRLGLLGDLQIGLSHRDVWARRDLFWPDYLMGAPPSRTNPAGQAWGYPVLDPRQYESGGPARELVTLRVRRMLQDFDGLRIDHPHGLVCPWVYDAGDPDPDRAVARGARLRCSPNLPDHPRLAPFAIPTAAQLSRDPAVTRYADDWVRELSPAQVERYGVLFDVVMQGVAAAGRARADVVCEVLSTWPFPLRQVMARHDLGRFCVTQKADLGRPDDVYRSENTSRNDWIMVGNHDTASLWALVERWHGTAAGVERALYLARRLAGLASPRVPRLARWIEADPRHLAHAALADLFAAPAAHVSLFFADLFGLRDTYNRPGVVDPENWTLRLTPSFLTDYRDRLREGRAANLPLAFALALGGAAVEREHAGRWPSALLASGTALSPSLGQSLTWWVDDAPVV
jgi:4-alpha-glucanotransferase